MEEDEASSEDHQSGWAAFQHRDFLLFCISRVLSGLAVQMQNVAVGWLVYDITRDPFALGLVGLAIFLPGMGLALPAGQVADRFDRRSVLIICYTLIGLVAAGLFLCARANIQIVWPIYALIFTFGVARAFSGPASQAIVPNLVPREHFGNAVAWNASIMQLATVVGPAAGGFIYAVGSSVVFGVATVCVALTIGFLSLMRPLGARDVESSTNWTTLLAGLKFIRSQPAIFGAISLDLFAVLLGGATALLPVYARDILDVGPWGLGLLRSMPAVGAVLTALLLAYRPLVRHAGRCMFYAVALFGVGTIGFGVSTSLPLSLAFLFILGAADMVSVIVRQTLIQVETPDAMRGRVAAVNSVFIGASNELGEFESGTVAALIGTVPCVVVGGVGTLIVAGLWAMWFPALRLRDRLIPEDHGS